MKKRTRRGLFWFAVLLFIGSSWIIIRYAEGYKYDFGTNHFVRTGAFSVSANTDAKLFVNDRLVGSLSLIRHDGGQDRLLPGTYTIRLVRDGWSSWRKDIIIQEGLLTDFPSVLILPTDESSQQDLQQEIAQDIHGSFTLRSTPLPTVSPTPSPSPKPHRTPSPTPEVQIGTWLLRGTQLFNTAASPSLVAEQVLGFAPIDGNARVFWWTRNELWVLWVRSTDYQPYHVAGDRELVSRWSVPILGAAWFRDRDHIVVDLGSSGYRVLELDTRGGLNIIKI